MQPNRIRRRWLGLLTAAIMVGSACGGSDAEPQAEPTGQTTQQQADQGEQQSSDASGELTIGRLCDPMAPLVVDLLGDDVTAVHNDFYADRADRLLDCGWESAHSDRTVRVGFNGAPDDFMINISAGKQDLPEIDAPNVYAPSRTDLRAPNGWTVTIQNLGADATDDREAMVAIASAALAAIAS